jgi:hypothetical protein
VSYARTRRLIIIVGVVVLLVTAGVMFARSVDTVEVLGVLLFIPVFLGFILWDIKGGFAGALLASALYVALRWDAIDQVGAGRFTGIIVSRVLAYLAFGLIGGWADRQLRTSLEKLDVYDQIDDATGLYNARFFLQDTDLEMARAQRYKTLFSVTVIDVPVDALDGLPKRKRRALVHDLGRLIGDGVRNVDRAAHGVDTRHRFAVICPETGPEGARIFTDRLAERVSAFLAGRGVNLDPAQIDRLAITVPGDDGRLQALREDFARIDQVEHPEHPERVAG